MIELFPASSILLISNKELVQKQMDQVILEVGTPPAIWVKGIEEAKRVLIDTDVELVVLDMPIAGEDGTAFAIELVRSRSMNFGIIMLIDPEQIKHNLYQAERMGIITLNKPLDSHLLVQTIRLLLAFQARIKKLQSHAERLQQKLEDDRLVNRAKLLLIENQKMKEQDAHHFIERKAMDACVRKTKIAKDIIRMYGTK